MQPRKEARPVPRAPAATAMSNRARLIRLVHVGRRELGYLDDATYRTILQAQGGASSSKDMSVVQLQAVVDFMKSQGFKVASKASAASRKVVVKGRRTGVSTAHAAAETGPVVLATDPESRKARAMWLTLHAIGQVRDPSEAALLAYTRRQCKVDRMEWVKDPIPLIESLKAWLLRSLPDKVTPYLREPAREWAAHMDEVWHENWSNSVRHLRLGLEKGNVQLLDEWVALWELVVAQSNRKWGN